MSTVHAGQEEQPLGSYGHFQLLARVPVRYADVVVEKWQSTQTGLTVLWANVDSPLVNGYITVASEVFDDSGVPHTLEHLVFLGSEQYPYKGVLDSLANRAFAQGTNAWTANDHTAYTLTTAGVDGFLRMLPVYLDHVFYPTLTDAGFTTEVYHVNEKGEDAGVVYSEMQGRENTAGDLIELKTQRMLYPPSSAYRSETGGLMAALRVLTIDAIRRYHARYYAPHNTAVVVCGPLQREALLDALAGVEERVRAKGDAHGPQGPPGWCRPFLETGSAKVPVIDGRRLEGDGTDAADPPAGDPLRRRVFIEFPEADESVGEVQLTWVGPALDAWLENHALDVLHAYLTDSPVSPVQQAFVEREHPVCTDVYFGTTERAGAAVLTALFSSVDAARLDALDTELVVLLREIAEKGLDMERMRMVLRRERLRLLSQIETRPADALSDVLITDFLYGRRDGRDLEPAFDEMRRFDALDQYTSADWAGLVRRYYVDAPRLVVVGRPSAALAESLKRTTRERVEQRRAELGEAGAAELRETLSQAQAKNDTPIPPGMLESFAVPRSETIAWIPVGTAASGPVPPFVTAPVPQTELDRAVAQHLERDGSAPPFYLQFDHVPSRFVHIMCVFTTAYLPHPLRPLLSLYLATLFSLPVRRLNKQGEELSYEQVVRALDDVALDYDAALGIGSHFAENVAVEIKVETSQYAAALGWLRDLLWGSIFSVERLRVAAHKLVQSLPEQKRDGRAVSWALTRSMLMSSGDSASLANSVLTQATAMPNILSVLHESPARVVEEMEDIRDTMLRPDLLRVSVAGDILALKEPRSTWQREFLPSDMHVPHPQPVTLTWAAEVSSELGKRPQRRGLICALSTIESSFAVFTTRGLTNYKDPDYAPLVVTITILNAMESFLWRYIRGAGLAYGATIRSDPEAQHIYFSLYRAPDAAKAFVEGRKVISALADEKNPLSIDQTTLESAISSLHYSVAESEGTVGAAALESFVDTIVKRTSKGHGQRLLAAASKVTLDDVQRCLVRYILPLFDAKSSVCAVAAAPSAVDAIQRALEDAGYAMERHEMPTVSTPFHSDSESDATSGTESDDV